MTSEQWNKLLRLRGLLALYVVLHHARNVYWPRMHALDASVTSWERGVYAFINVIGQWGLFAVLAFFVISGLSIGVAYSQSFKASRFFVARLRRLYPALLFSILLSGALLLARGGNIKNEVLNFFATLTFQNEITFGSAFAENSPYWSLACEGWYYVFYPFLGICLFSSVGILGLMCGAIAFSFLFYNPGSGDAVAFFSVWLMGVMLAKNVSKAMGGKQLALALFMLFGGVLCCAFCDLKRIALYPSSVVNPLVLAASLGMGGVVLYIIQNENRMLWRRLRNFLGNISYSLYLVHYPIMLTIASFKIWRNGVPGCISGSLVAILVSIGVAFISWKYFEVPFMKRRSA